MDKQIIQMEASTIAQGSVYMDQSIARSSHTSQEIIILASTTWT
jgi:hypothetical protein